MATMVKARDESGNGRVRKALAILLSIVLACGLCPGLAHAQSTPLTSAVVSQGTQDAAASKKYSYSAKPMLAPFNLMLYVKTDNPDPTSFQLVDKSSTYLDEEGEVATYSALPRTYLDVKYENVETRRVKGGYLFYCRDVNSDGGILHVQEKDGWYGFRDTGQTVKVPALEDSLDYLIDTRTKDKTDFFDKLGAIEAALYEYSSYPRSVFTSGLAGEDHGWPGLTVYEYGPGHGLTERFSRASTYVLQKDLQPYVLDSISFPSFMADAAWVLNPECSVSRGSEHWEVVVTYNGESHTYGWEGEGGPGPLFSKTVSGQFAFDGSETDLAFTSSIASLRDGYLGILAKSDGVLAEYRDLVAGETFKKDIGAGSWVSIAIDDSNYLYESSAYSYVIGSDSDSPHALMNTWVDGRYLDTWSRWETGAKFSDHRNASILLRNRTFTDSSGASRTCDLLYDYDAETGTWRVKADDYGFAADDLPSAFILTASQVSAMKVDANTNKLPVSGKVYDGSKAPGTPFENTPVTGISINEKKATLFVNGATLQLKATVAPAKATEQGYTWTSTKPRVASVSENGVVTGLKAGTAKIAATSVDGGFKTVCTVKVVKPKGIKKATIARIPAQKWKGKAVEPKPKVTFKSKKLIAGKDYTLSYANNTGYGNGPATVTVTGINAFKGSVTKKFTIRRLVKAPKAKSFAYDGAMHRGVKVGAGYRLWGSTTASEVGAYTAYAAPDAGCAWKDGSRKTLALRWKIK